METCPHILMRRIPHMMLEGINSVQHDINELLYEIKKIQREFLIKDKLKQKDIERLKEKLENRKMEIIYTSYYYVILFSFVFLFFKQTILMF